MQVVVFHLYSSIPRLSGTPGASIVMSGFVGVGLFFALSGFVLAYNYLMPGSPGVGGARRFFAARFARIYPVYLLGVCIAFPIFLTQLRRRGEPDLLAAASKILLLVTTLLQSWVPTAACRINCPGWSLSDEAFFYLLFPVLTIPLVRLAPRRLLLSCLAFWGVAMAIAALYVAQHPDGQPITSHTSGVWINVLRYNPLVRLPEFVGGICIGLLFLRMEPSRHRQFARFTVPTFVLLLLALSVANSFQYAYLPVFFAPLFAALILAFACGGGLLGKMLATRTFQLLGESSFALYVLHVPFFVHFKRFVSWLGADINESTWLPLVYLVLIQAIAIAVYLFFEEPLRRMIRRRLSQSPTDVVVSGKIPPTAKTRAPATVPDKREPEVLF